MSRRARGYTVIEVMIAVTLITLGVSGVVALQKVTTVANRDAQSLAIANQIARTWLDRLRTDAVAWNLPSPSNPTGKDIDSDTQWLKMVDGAAGWFQPAYVEGWGGPAFDQFGTDVSNTEDPPKYCTHIRLQWLYGPPDIHPPPNLLRAEIRVFWLRDGVALPEGMSGICDPSADPDQLGALTDTFHFVYATSAIKQNAH